MKADLGALAKWRKTCAGAVVLVASSLIVVVPNFFAPPVNSGVDDTYFIKPEPLAQRKLDEWPTWWAHSAVKTEPTRQSLLTTT